MSFRRVNCNAVEQPEILIAAVKSNDIEAVVNQLDVEVDPNSLSDMPWEVCYVLSASETRSSHYLLFSLQDSSIVSLACYGGSRLIVAILLASGGNLEYQDSVS